MKNEVAEELAKKYPELLGDACISKREPERYRTFQCPSPWQAYGWETPDGWTELLTKLIEELHEVVKPYYNTEESLQIAQVKSKFAELRFYLDRCPQAVSEQVGSIIEKYCTLSRSTSEISGQSPASVKNISGWLYTVTDEEAKQLQEEHDARMKRYAEEAEQERKRRAAMTPEQLEAERKQQEEESRKFWEQYKETVAEEKKKLEEAETTIIQK